MRSWTAYVAPLGVLAEDGRVLSPDVEWTLKGRPAVLFPPEGHYRSLPIGEVTGIHRPDPVRLMLTGTLLDGVDVASLEGLAPELQLDRANGPGEWSDPFDCVRGLVLGQRPIWPDLWFRLDQVPADA